MYRSAKISVAPGAVSSVFADAGEDPQGDWELLLVASSGTSLVFCDDVSGNGTSMAVSATVSSPSRIRVSNSEVFIKNTAGGTTLDINAILTQV